tara:strand:- start:819 stop:1193 length:375 start_codon:yes stop_codon:yes gene_type:complete
MLKKYCKLEFGSRWLEDIDEEVFFSDDSFDGFWNDWKKEMIEEDCEYMIDEFGRYEINKVRNIVVMCLSDDSEEWYVEYNDGNMKLIEEMLKGYDRSGMIINNEKVSLDEGLEIYLDDFSEKVL